MGEEEACLNKKQKKKIQVGRCDKGSRTNQPTNGQLDFKRCSGQLKT